MVERCSDLEAELKSLGIESFAIDKAPTGPHLVGYLFRLEELLKERDLEEARRFSRSFPLCQCR